MVEVKYDQHFLVDRSVIEKSIETAKISSTDVIFEIGPGRGILSEAILNAGCSKLISCEIDENLEGNLKVLERDGRFKLIYGNALEIMEDFTFDKIIANIPYGITEPLYQEIMRRRIKCCVLLHGKKFYENIVKRNTRWNYFVNAFYDIELIDTVYGNSFEPFAKVKSALVKLVLKEKFTKWDVMLQNLFFRRFSKTRNALVEGFRRSFKITKNEAKLKVDELMIDVRLVDKNLDDLSNDEFVDVVEECRKLF